MRPALTFLLGAGLLCSWGFGPHPTLFGVMYPLSHFLGATPIAAYRVQQKDTLIQSRGVMTRDELKGETLKMTAEIGPIEYSVPFTAWLPFYQSGVIEARIPVQFLANGQTIGARPDGNPVPADHIEVSVKVARYGILPLGALDGRVEYVVLEGVRAGIAKRVEDGNLEIAARQQRTLPSK